MKMTKVNSSKHNGRKARNPYELNNFQGSEEIQEHWKRKNEEQDKIKVLLINGKSVIV